MNKNNLRIIAATSAVFAAAFAVMLLVNFWVTTSSTSLSAPILETLKELNYDAPGNAKLVEQIRELDLLSRRAYFVRSSQLEAGVYILLGMSIVLVVSLVMLNSKYRSLPQKEVDPIDEWAQKTLARKYVRWGAAAVLLLAVGLGVATRFQISDLPAMRSRRVSNFEVSNSTSQVTDEIFVEDEVVESEAPPAEATATAQTVAQPTAQPATATAPVATAPAVEVSKVTSNAFRGNNSNGISSAKNIPTEWSVEKNTNILWKVDTRRQGFSSPIINSNRVFITAADKDAREIYCYDLLTGELLWTARADNILGSPATPPEVTDDTGLAASSPATNGKQVVAIFATGDMLCVDYEGKRLWAKNIGVPDNTYGYASSLLCVGSSVYVQCDNSSNRRLIAMDVATGSERWSVNRSAERTAWSSPIMVSSSGKSSLIIAGNPHIISYNPASGQENWKLRCLSGEVAVSPSYTDGVVFGANEYAKLVAVDLTNGEKLWEDNELLPDVSSPVAVNGCLFLATGYGAVAAYDAKTGEKLTAHEYSTQFYASPMYADGKIYLFDTDGKAYIFEASRDFKLLRSFDTGLKTFATPAFSDGKIVVRTESGMYCAGKRD